MKRHNRHGFHWAPSTNDQFLPRRCIALHVPNALACQCGVHRPINISRRITSLIYPFQLRQIYSPCPNRARWMALLCAPKHSNAHTRTKMRNAQHKYKAKWPIPMAIAMISRNPVRFRFNLRIFKIKIHFSMRTASIRERHGTRSRMKQTQKRRGDKL